MVVAAQTLPYSLERHPEIYRKVPWNIWHINWTSFNIFKSIHWLQKDWMKKILPFLLQLKHIYNANMDREDQDQEGEIWRTGSVDSSLRMGLAFQCLYCEKVFFCGTYLGNLHNFKYFGQLSTELNNWGLKWKLNTLASYFEKKISNFRNYL